MLIDTDVLVWYLRGHPGAKRFLDGASELRLSAVSYMELVQGCRNKQELTQLKKDLDRRKAAVLPLTERISGQAVALIEAHALADGLQLADALIAATALAHGLPLATGNTKHFQAVEGLGLAPFAP